MKHFTLTLAAVAAFGLGARAQTFTYDFSAGYDNWSGDFADYPSLDSVFYELEFGRTTLPSPLNTSKYALRISGNNHSDDLFMFIKRKVTGLLPNTTYTVLIDIDVASIAPTDAFGVGGSPGESVYFKAGATLIEPKKVLNLVGEYHMNIDKGNQAMEGVDTDNIGHVGVSDTTTVFTMINRNNSGSLFTITTDINGEVWICIGTDSGFEATTTLYYSEITLTFTAVLGLDRLPGAEAFLMYPNPSNGHVNFDHVPAGSTIDVYNPFGQKIHSVKNNAAQFSMDLSSFAKGVYLVQVSDKHHTYTRKLVVE